MSDTIRGYPPVGMYIGKVREIKIGQRESRSGNLYDAGEVRIEASGGPAGIAVNASFDIGNVTFGDLDKIRSIPKDTPFVFEVVQNGSYPGFGFIGTKVMLENLVGQLKKAEA